MLSKIDLRDFLEINQGLYDEPISARQLAQLQALTQALEQQVADRRAGLVAFGTWSAKRNSKRRR